MRFRSTIVAFIGLLTLLLPGCGLSIHAVDKTTPTASLTTPSATLSPAVSRPTASSSPTTTQPTPTPMTTTATTPAQTKPTVTPSPTPQPATAPPVVRPTSPPQPVVPTPTPAPAAPTSTPTPVASTPNCTDMPVRGFGLLWSSNSTVARTVGCPLAPEIGLSARVQLYQSGVMIWLDTLSPGIDQAPWVLTLIGDSVARYRVPADGPAWNDGAREPSGAFKWVWDNIYSVQQSMGAPLDPWYATDAAIQRFDHGTMLWLRQPPSGDRPMIDVFPDDLLTVSTTTYQSYVDEGAQ